MKTLFYYLLVEPVRGGFHDSADAPAALTLQVQTKTRMCELAIFTDDQKQPTYARLMVPKLPDETIPEELLPLIQEVKEHLIAALRFGYNQQVTYFPHPFWTFVDEGAPQNIGIDISLHGHDELDVERTRQMFVAGFPFRQEIRLWVDAADGRIPLQYRYLSAYKLLELEFKSKGKWKKKELETFLQAFEKEAQDLGIKKTLSKYLHEMRDKCAHIRTGKDAFGITHLDNKQAAEVEKVLPLLGKAGMAVINRRGGKKFSMHHGPKPAPLPTAIPESAV